MSSVSHLHLFHLPLTSPHQSKILLFRPYGGISTIQGYHTLIRIFQLQDEHMEGYHSEELPAKLGRQKGSVNSTAGSCCLVPNAPVCIFSPSMDIRMAGAIPTIISTPVYFVHGSLGELADG